MTTYISSMGDGLERVPTGAPKFTAPRTWPAVHALPLESTRTSCAGSAGVPGKSLGASVHVTAADGERPSNHRFHSQPLGPVPDAPDSTTSPVGPTRTAPPVVVVGGRGDGMDIFWRIDPSARRGEAPTMAGCGPDPSIQIVPSGAVSTLSMSYATAATSWLGFAKTRLPFGSSFTTLYPVAPASTLEPGPKSNGPK